MAAVVRVEDVSKVYRLGDINRKVFLEELKRKWGGASEPPKEVCALRNVTFNVEEGEVLGIIGHNGSGKSTLLKILSHITAPTSGRVLIKGRVASLLEVGTGFHPDLTGRDNVFLNGVILGMSNQEVARKYDEIVAFSGVEEFMDTPVKHYSSGMRVRLAFAVAAHLEPEILVIDEVLAVGDQSFQQKCVGKLGSVARSGRTVLFVSHNAAAVETLCSRGIVLDHGRLVFSGGPSEAIRHYAESHRPAQNNSLDGRRDRVGTGEVVVTAIDFRDGDGRPLQVAVAGAPLEICLQFENRARQPWPHLVATVAVRTELGTPVFQQQNRLTGESFGRLPDAGTFVCRLPRLMLPASTYRVDFAVHASTHGGAQLDSLKNAAELSVETGNVFGTGEMPLIDSGVCLMDGSWRLEESPARAASATVRTVAAA